MSKQITPLELAEIVNGLLIKPDLLGELEDSEQHEAFMLAIGNVVAEHCGGMANWVAPSGECFDPDSGASSPLLSVSPDENLPSLSRNVWSCYDPHGWEDDIEEGGEQAELMSENEVKTLRRKLQALVINAATANAPAAEPLHLTLPMVDWRVLTDAAVEDEADAKPYEVSLTYGNQTYVTFREKGKDDAVLDLVLEIDKGVPTLHMAPSEGDFMLHIHSVDDTLALTPDNANIMFKNDEPNRYNYHDGRSIVCTVFDEAHV